MANDPIYQLPRLYISGCNISVASTTVLAIAPGYVRDYANNIDMGISYPNLQGNTNPATVYNNYMPPLYVNSATVGANGLDAGTLAASTSYSIYVIGDSRGYNYAAGLISLSSNAYPLLPSGYDTYRLLGFAPTNGSTQFTAATILNASSGKSYYLSPGTSVLSGGTATSFTAVDCSSAIPTTTSASVIGYFLITFTPLSSGSSVSFRPTGSSATSGLVTISAGTAGIAQTQYQALQLGVASSVPKFDYKNSDASSTSVVCLGYTVSLS